MYLNIFIHSIKIQIKKKYSVLFQQANTCGINLHFPFRLSMLLSLNEGNESVGSDWSWLPPISSHGFQFELSAAFDEEVLLLFPTEVTHELSIADIWWIEDGVVVRIKEVELDDNVLTEFKLDWGGYSLLDAVLSGFVFEQVLIEQQAKGIK